VNELDRRTAGAFVTDVLAKGRKPETVNRLLSTFTQLWKWMERRGHVEANPWTNQRVTVKRSDGEANNGDRRGFTEKEGRDFLAALEGVDKDVVSVAAVTGMRLEEIAASDCKDATVERGVVWLEIPQGKTAAAARRMPIVDASVRKMLTERKDANNGRLFHELEADRFGDFGSALSKRVGRKLRGIGLTDPALVADHSWRHRARTLMEHANVAPWVADAMLGHARPGEGLGRYSEGPSDKQLVEAAKTITLPS
jgi:integrase